MLHWNSVSPSMMIYSSKLILFWLFFASYFPSWQIVLSFSREFQLGYKLSPLFVPIFLRVHLLVRLNSLGSNLSEGEFWGHSWQDFVWEIRLLAFSRDGSSKVLVWCESLFCQITSLWWMIVRFTSIWGSDSINENNVKGLLVWIAWWILAHTFVTCLMLECSGLTFCLEDLSGGMMLFCLASYFFYFLAFWMFCVIILWSTLVNLVLQIGLINWF